MIVKVPGEGYTAGMTGIVPKFSATEGEIRTIGGALGRDTGAVLSDWLGLSKEACLALHEEGVVQCGETSP